ncbi:MAG: hypothetical protein ABID84_01120 [Chloroflexota bacterium]
MVLEVFHPREEDSVRVSHEVLRPTVAALVVTSTRLLAMSDA